MFDIVIVVVIINGGGSMIVSSQAAMKEAYVATKWTSHQPVDCYTQDCQPQILDRLEMESSVTIFQYNLCYTCSKVKCLSLACGYL